MNIVRIVISLFIAVLMTVSTIGWIWTGTHQTASQAAASLVVLTLGVVAGLVGLVALWRPDAPRGRDEESTR
jgi:hypothetical protein